MRKITIILIILILFSSIGNAENVYEKELHITEFTEINFDRIQEEAEEIGWHDYYMKLRNEKVGIYDDTIYHSWLVTPFVPELIWVHNIARKEIEMVEYDIEEEKANFEINKDRLGFNISLISANIKEIKSENLKIIYEDDVNGRIEIKEDHIVNEKNEEHKYFWENNIISILVPLDTIDMDEFSLYIINRDYQRLDLHWSFKPAE